MWFRVDWCSFKNKHLKDMCSREIGLHAQNMTTITSSIVSIIRGDFHDHLMSMRIFTLNMNKVCMGAPKIYRKVATALM
jgi:hypothetical protein